MSGRAWTAGAGLAGLLAGCAGALPPPPDPAPTAPSPPVGRQSEPPVRGSFAYAGAMVQGGVVVGTAPAGTVRLTLDGQEVAGEGRFLIAFDRDAARAATLEATLADGSTVRDTLRIHPRAWRIERLANLPRFSQPDGDFLRRRKGELERIAAARARDTGAQGWRQRFVWPVTGRISGLKWRAARIDPLLLAGEMRETFAGLARRH